MTKLQLFPINGVSVRVDKNWQRRAESLDISQVSSLIALVLVAGIMPKVLLFRFRIFNRKWFGNLTGV